MNGLDYAIVFAFLAVIGLGFFGGVVRVIAAIIAIYIGTVVAGAFYLNLSRAFRDYVSSISLATSQLFVFILTFLVTSIVIWVAISKGFKGIRFPRRLEIADNLGGATLGVIVSGLAVTLAVMLLSILLQVLNQSVATGGTGGLGSAVQTQIRNSQLVPVFLDLSPYFARVMSPWFPNGIPAILK